jgi:hypothetical protein
VGFLFEALLTATLSPLTLLFQAFNAEGMINIIIYLPPVALTAYLLVLRANLDSPLCSEKAKDYFSTFLSTHRSYWPYFMMVSSAVGFSCFWLLYKLGNPFLSDSVVSWWGQLLFLFSFMVIAGYLLILWSVVLMSSFSASVQPLELFSSILKSCFASFCKDEVCILRIIETEKRSASLFTKKRKLPHVNYDFFQKLILISLLVILFMASDKALQIVNPAIQVISTEYTSTGINVVRFWNGSLLYTVQVEKTFWIGLPMMLTRNLNLTIQNPSNLSISRDSEFVSLFYGDPRELKVYPDKALSYTPLTDTDGRTLYLEVMPLNSSLQVQSGSSVKLAYSDMLNINPIDISGPNETTLSNGSIAVVTSLLINNTEELGLYGGEFPLFRVSNYGNLTSYTSFVNGTEQPSPLLNTVDYNNWLWFQNILSVPSKSTMNITVYASFQGGT